MKSINICQFVKIAGTKDLQKFADKVCNGSIDYLKYQICPKRRFFSVEKAILAEKIAKKLGYNLPKHKLRPDIWDS